jgi:hypothetical protein
MSQQNRYPPQQTPPSNPRYRDTRVCAACGRPNDFRFAQSTRSFGSYIIQGIGLGIGFSVVGIGWTIVWAMLLAGALSSSL